MSIIIRATFSMTLFALSSALHSAEEPRPVRLGDYVLGMTIDSAREVPVVGLVSDYQYGLMCSDQPQYRNQIYISDEQRAEGLVVCKVGNLTRGTTANAGMIYFGAIPLEPTFYFHKGHLISISASQTLVWQDRYIAALEGRYGEPDSTSNSSAANAFGVKVDQVIRSWKRGDHLIVVRTPDSSLDRFGVDYSDVPKVSQVQASIKAREVGGAGI